jgi:hypothetical protein
MAIINKLTPEQKAKIPEFIEKYVSLASQPTNRVKATKAVQDLYENAGFKKPIVIFGQSPLATANMAFMTKILFANKLIKDVSYLSNELNSHIYSQLDSQLRSQLIKQLNSQLGGQLYSQLHSQLIKQLNSQVRSQFSSQLDSEFRNQLHSQLYKQLDSQLGSQLDNQLGSELRSELRSELHSQLYNQLDSQLDSQLGSQLGSQLDSQLYSQLHSQLDSQLDSQLYSQLDNQLGSELDSQLGSQLGDELNIQLNIQLYNQLYNQLNSQLRSQLFSQLFNQLDSQLDIQLYSQLIKQLRSQLSNINSNWLLIFWWLVWAGWYDYAKYIGVKFDNKIFKIFMDFVTNVSFIIPYYGIAFVSENPQIEWKEGKLHSETGMAVKYADGWGMYSLYGVIFKEKLYKKVTSKRATCKTILNIKNMEQRMAALKLHGVEKIIEQATLLDKSKRGNELYLLKNVFSQDAYFLKYTCPSTGRVYFSGIDPEVGEKKDADLSMSWKLNLTKEEYNNLEIES